MANPVDLGLRIVQALDGIGIKAGSFLGKASNVKKAMFGKKSTMFKPNAIQSIRGEGGDFGTALKLIEEEAQYIVNATDAEKMAFLNNLNDYKDLGGPLKKDIVASKQFEEGIGSLKDDIESLQSTAKTMKDDAEKGLKSAEDDLKTFLETGGNPLKKKEPKYLGGSMHEEGQLRTAIRTFLKNEYKNGRIKLDETDKFRVMEYSPMMEDDPIKVFKKIYGDEAYKRAGTFPGAFETGESFNHYESIFRSKMGEDILKVKDKKYVGDGTLLLTDEVITPTPDDDVPFAKGGRASFAGGGGLKKIVQEIVEYITTKFTPMDAMKEVNKVIGKTGKYKNLKLTDDDINDIVEGSNDFIFQRDPDNLFVEGSIKERTKYFDEDDVLERDLFAPKSNTQVFKDSEGGIKGITMGGDDEFKKAMSEAMEEGMRESENMKRLGLDPTNMKDALKYEEMKAAGQLEKNVTGSADLSPAEDLKREFPGISDENVRLILADTNPQRIAEVKQTMREAMEMEKKGMSVDDIINAFKNSNRTKQADGGITKLRNGYYGGGQAMIEPDLSDIGHGSDALMSRTRITAPGSQATTSTGLNYLLGEDNDNTRVPFNEGLLAKPSDSMMVDTTTSSPDFYNTDKFEEDSMTYLKGMYGTGKDSNQFLYNEMIKKGNELRKQGVDRETVIKIIRRNKNKIDEILRQQEFKDILPKSLAGLAEGGVAGLRQGYVGGGGVNLARRGFLKVLAGTGAAVAAFKTGALKLLGKTTTKAAPKLFTAAEGSGAPAWFEGMVNKVLADGVDITKKAATMDGQTVKSLDTPTGKVDVTIDRTGNIDVNYMGDNTALGESVNMRYVPGVADEGTKGVKPADEFEAVESIPEGKAYGPDDYEIEMGENVTDNVGNLFSDTTELAELGGQKTLTKDIVETVKRKKILKQMENDPSDFVTDTQGDFVQFDDINPDPN